MNIDRHSSTDYQAEGDEWGRRRRRTKRKKNNLIIDKRICFRKGEEKKKGKILELILRMAGGGKIWQLSDTGSGTVLIRRWRQKAIRRTFLLPPYRRRMSAISILAQLEFPGQFDIFQNQPTDRCGRNFDQRIVDGITQTLTQYNPSGSAISLPLPAANKQSKVRQT